MESSEPEIEVSVTRLRQDLADYVARARRGERIRVVSRGEVVAELVPPVYPANEVNAAKQRLHGSVRRYVRPLDPVIDPAEWDVNR